MNEAPRYRNAGLHAETARIFWPELETHFARGVVLQVEAALDLVEVATCFANDDRQAADAWVRQEQVQHLDVETAKRWSGSEVELWAVVVAPWILVQERKA